MGRDRIQRRARVGAERRVSQGAVEAKADKAVTRLDHGTEVRPRIVAEVTLRRGRMSAKSRGGHLSGPGSGGVRAFLNHLTDGPEAWVYKRRQGRHLVLRADTMAPADGPSASGLMIFDPEHVRHVWADFGSAPGLTRAECRVVKLLIEGLDVDLAAERLGISVETVRTHIRNLYAKLGVRNRQQLFALASPFRLHWASTRMLRLAVYQSSAIGSTGGIKINYTVYDDGEGIHYTVSPRSRAFHGDIFP